MSRMRRLESHLTEEDRIQSRFEVGDSVAFRAKGGTRLSGCIEKFNRKTATVRQGPQRWRVPYSLLEPLHGERRDDKQGRLLEVAREARELMDIHGLDDWTFCFSAARRTIGLCKEKEKTIQLGRRHAANDAPEQATDTILHEIAHALAGTAAGHGPAWRNAAKRVGATPRASKASDPAADEATRTRLHIGARLSFLGARGQRYAGTVVKLNRKTARVFCDGRLLLVPYGCILKTDGQASAEF